MEESLPLKIITRVKSSGLEETMRIIDHAVHQDRVWLGSHIHWAVRNGRSVNITPADYTF